ncbi:MAG: hypothetical protein K2X11_00800 [Acetobacteraceae bacterium]|nr:hypothetical protein [Acetobacteraceae bacterium]
MYDQPSDPVLFAPSAAPGSAGAVRSSSPAAPEILGVFPDTGASTSDRITASDFLIVFGRARAGATLELLVGSTIRGAATAGADGSWQAVPDPAAFSSEGVYDLWVREVGGSQSGAFRLTLDRTPPPAPVIVSIGEDAASPYETTLSLPTIRVQLPPGESAVLSASINGEAVAVLADNSAWRISPAAPLALGTHLLQVAATDAAGNMSVTRMEFAVADANPPTATSVTLPAAGVRRAGDQLVFTIQMSEPVQLDRTLGPLPYLEVVAGSQTLRAPLLLEGGPTETRFGLTVPDGILDLDGIVLRHVVFPGPSIRDAAGLAWDGAVLRAAPDVRIDAVAPTASLATAQSLVGAGATLRVVLATSEAVHATASSVPITLSVGIGGGVRDALHDPSASTATRLAFTLVVADGEFDDDGVTIGTLDDPAGRLVDSAGNPLTFDGGGAALAGLRVDGIAPTARLTALPDGPARLGDRLTFVVTTSEPVALGAGFAQVGLALDVAGTQRLAALDEGASDPLRLVFRWTIPSGDLDTDGITLHGLSDVAGRLTDLAGNRLLFSDGAALPTVVVDGVAPSAVLQAGSGAIKPGEQATFTLHLSEPVSVPADSGIGLTLAVGRRSATASLDASLSSPTSLVFTYTARPGDFDADGIAVTGLVDPGARLVDAAGNRLHFDSASAPLGPTVALPDYALRWRKPDASLSEWKISATADVTAGPSAAVTGWTPIMTAQVDGRHGVDTIWQSADGRLYAWLDAPAGVFEGRDIGSAGPGWQLAAAGDLNGDGRDDLLWLGHQSWYVWQLGEALAMGGGGLAQGWAPAAVADFRGSGRDDILWRHADGSLFLWEMQGATFVRGTPVGTVGAEWRIAGAADYSGDGKADLIFQHAASGDVWGWRMNGAFILAWEWLASAGPDWTIAGVDASGGAATVHLRSDGGHVWRWVIADGQISDSRPLGTIGESILL